MSYEDSDIRRAFATHLPNAADYTLTPTQIERGLTDSDWVVRRVFEERQAEWRAQWEAQELKKRHADVVSTKSKAEAL